jgi:pyruvate dehydrogenase complex dehydrogenase (E1) component
VTKSAGVTRALRTWWSSFRWKRFQLRVLWLATRIVDVANRERPNRDSIKVGDHQASSASLVSVMTALWFHHLGPGDRVSVKPLLCDALGRIAADPGGTSAAEREEGDGGAAYYFRLSTRPLDQQPFAAARERLGDAVLRRQGLAGAYRLVDATDDAASHWLGSALGVPSLSLGVDEFGQSGSIQDLYEVHDLTPGSIVNAALAVLAS